MLHLRSHPRSPLFSTGCHCPASQHPWAPGSPLGAPQAPSWQQGSRPSPRSSGGGSSCHQRNWRGVGWPRCPRSTPSCSGSLMQPSERRWRWRWPERPDACAGDPLEKPKPSASAGPLAPRHGAAAKQQPKLASASWDPGGGRLAGRPLAGRQAALQGCLSWPGGHRCNASSLKEKQRRWRRAGEGRPHSQLCEAAAQGRPGRARAAPRPPKNHPAWAQPPAACAASAWPDGLPQPSPGQLRRGSAGSAAAPGVRRPGSAAGWLRR